LTLDTFKDNLDIKRRDDYESNASLSSALATIKIKQEINNYIKIGCHISLST